MHSHLIVGIFVTSFFVASVLAQPPDDDQWLRRKRRLAAGVVVPTIVLTGSVFASFALLSLGGPTLKCEPPNDNDYFDLPSDCDVTRTGLITLGVGVGLTVPFIAIFGRELDLHLRTGRKSRLATVRPAPGGLALYF